MTKAEVPPMSIVGMIFRPSTTTIVACSSYPEGVNLGEFAREIFHKLRAVEMSVCTVADIHPGLHKPRRSLGWTTTWNNNDAPIKYPTPQRFTGWSRN